MKMEAEDLINLPASSNSGDGNDNIDLNSSTREPTDAESIPSNSEVKEDEESGEIKVIDMEIEEEDKQTVFKSENDKELVKSKTEFQDSVEVTEAKAVDKIPLGDHKRDGNPIVNPVKDSSSVSGVKRPRMAVDEQQSSVHVVYSSLPRDSKLKLEELLQKWSEWHTRHFPPSHDSSETLDSGEKTYFPALHVGADKPSAVSFWMDNQTRNPMSSESIPLDSASVPLYDRGYSLGLTSTDISGNPTRGMGSVDSSRCFNCGSYNHSMKECHKPRDNTAVSNARKQHKSKRNQNPGSRNPTRYYQNSPRGKYDASRPGVLQPETRQLLGLGELDPPPWLNRMRELGYPPGYLDPEDADLPSGITIFGEEEIKVETEDGEILEENEEFPEVRRKMSVEFAGINGPIPENADEGRWTDGPSRSDLSRNRSSRRHRHHQSEQQQRWSSRDEAPPGVEPATYSQRYGGVGGSGGGGGDSTYPSYTPRRDLSSVARSPSDDRGRRSPLVYESSSPQHRHLSPHRSSAKRDDDYRENDEQSRHTRRRR